VLLQEVRKIWRVTSTQSFEGQGGKFKPYQLVTEYHPYDIFVYTVYIVSYSKYM